MQQTRKPTIGHWWRHLTLDGADARKVLPLDARQRLEQRIKDSEARHLGELRVCVEASLRPGALWHGITPRQRAIELFGELGVWDTEYNNGVLIYLLLADRRIEILADRGLARKMGRPNEAFQGQGDLWASLVETLAAGMKTGQAEAGLAQAIDAVGELLHQHYPAPAGLTNPNELPDAIVLI